MTKPVGVCNVMWSQWPANPVAKFVRTNNFAWCIAKTESELRMTCTQMMKTKFVHVHKIFLFSLQMLRLSDWYNPNGQRTVSHFGEKRPREEPFPIVMPDKRIQFPSRRRLHLGSSSTRTAQQIHKTHIHSSFSFPIQFHSYLFRAKNKNIPANTQVNKSQDGLLDYSAGLPDTMLTSSLCMRMCYSLLVYIIRWAHKLERVS